MSRVRSLACISLAVAVLFAAACTPQAGTPGASGARNASPLRATAVPGDLARQLQHALQARSTMELQDLVPSGSLLTCTYRGHCNSISARDALARLDEVLRNAQDVQVSVENDVPAGSPAERGQIALRVSVKPLVMPDPMNGVYYYETLMLLRPAADGWEWFAWHVRMPASGQAGS